MEHDQSMLERYLGDQFGGHVGQLMPRFKADQDTDPGDEAAKCRVPSLTNNKRILEGSKYPRYSRYSDVEIGDSPNDNQYGAYDYS